MNTVLRIASIVLLLSTAAGVSAHHRGDHRVLALGTATTIVVKTAVCDTEEQVMNVVNTQLEHGLEAAMQVWARYQQMPGNGGAACGAAEGYLAPVRLLWSGMLTYQTRELDTAVVEADLLVMTRAGAPTVFRIFAILPDVRVVEDESFFGTAL